MFTFAMGTTTEWRRVSFSVLRAVLSPHIQQENVDHLPDNIMHLREMALLMSQQPDNDEELKAMRMKRKTIYKLVLLFM